MSGAPKVLIVEDEAIISLDIETQLNQLGFAVTGTARSAEEALALIESNTPDLILMDIRIHGDIDGIEAAALIRERYRLPVIYLTAHADDATLMRAEATEPFGYIVKPLQHFKLKAIITMALRRHKAERELEESQALLSKALEELAVAKRAAEAASRAKSDFLARMSHEIRTPMNLIMGMTGLVLESELSDKQKQHLEIAHRNVRRLLRLINGILDLSKVEAGELTFAAVPFDLNELLNECAATMAAAIERKGLTLEILADVSINRYWIGDALRLQQVLLNLIGNSIKFTAEGKIEVRVHPHLNEHAQKGLRFEVSDTGCGIPRDKTALIFEAFQQVDGSINRRYEGTGLGLAIAKTLVERMGGRIWVDEPTNGPGAKFIFTTVLPPATEHEFRSTLESRTQNRESSQIPPGSRLLLVEDNADNVALVKAYLDNLPLTLDVAENGVEAVAKRRSQEFDVILMDVQMPIMDGYAATRAIRAWETERGARRTPIIAVTAHALNGASAASLAAGCDAHLAKPIERNDLLEAITKFAGVLAPAAPQKLPDMISARRPVFLANRRTDLAKLLAALEDHDFTVIQRIAHNCKGTGTGYGFPRITEIGALLEKAAKAQDAAGSADLIDQFKQYLESASEQAA